jgi:esterase/lipase superfamily enzyme
MVAANREFTTEDLLKEEAEIIRESFVAHKTRVNITTTSASTEDDLVERVRESVPDILHFTGHGDPSGEILLRTAEGPLRRKTGKSLARILRTADVVPQCIVLNNCSVFRGERNLLSVCENLVRMTPYGAFDYSLGFARNFYRSFAKTDKYEAAFGETISGMKEAGLLTSIKIEFKRGEPSPTPLGGIEFDEPRIYRDVADSVAGAPNVKATRSEASFGRKYRVWFGTNRKPLNMGSNQIAFGTDRDAELHYGYCEVAIPKYHKIGSVGTVWWKRWPAWQDDRLRIVSTTPLVEEGFWSELQEDIASLSKKEKTVLLFVHGYNVSFEGAALRTAQMGADLKVTGPSAFFSWPSKGRVKDYAADVASIEGSEGLLRAFLEQLTIKSGAERIHVIAHSMGNRGTIRAFNTLLANVSAGSKVRFGQIFLAAPDIDVQLFKQLAIAYPKLSDRTTMYVSARDKALWGSSFLHDYPRAGYKPPTTVVAGIDTVEVSNIDLTFLGHGYIAAARTVLQDMHALMLANTPPEKRMGIESVSDDVDNVPKYWRIRA